MVNVEDYPYYIIQFVLENWEDINDLKYKVTSELRTTEYIYPTKEWELQEGNTLTRTDPSTTRIPHNSNNLIENLCVLTADIELAQKRMLTNAEKLSLYAVCRFTDREFTPEIKETAAIALQKITQYLNR